MENDGDSKKYFAYGDEEISYLKGKDKNMADAITKIGMIKREVRPDIFPSLIRSIVGQQISTKAQLTIVNRIENGLTNITPENILSCSDEILQSYGLSFRKVSYMKNLAEHVHSHKLDLESFKHKEDKEVIAELTELKGIGVWTAEMLMIHSLERPDVFSYGDLAIIRGLRLLHSHRSISKDKFEFYRRRYSPYCTVASFYLWAIAGGALPSFDE